MEISGVRRTRRLGDGGAPEGRPEQPTASAAWAKLDAAGPPPGQPSAPRDQRDAVGGRGRVDRIAHRKGAFLLQGQGAGLPDQLRGRPLGDRFSVDLSVDGLPLAQQGTTHIVDRIVLFRIGQTAQLEEVELSFHIAFARPVLCHENGSLKM